MQRNASSGLVKHWGPSAGWGVGQGGAGRVPTLHTRLPPSPSAGRPSGQALSTLPRGYLDCKLLRHGRDRPSLRAWAMWAVVDIGLVLYQTWSEHILLLPRRTHVSDRGGDILLWF